jgi:hypothetical protein
MNGKILRSLMAAALLGPLAFFAAPLGAQERELDLERILNPMPDYDPFEKSSRGLKFFPDEVDKRVRETLIDALIQRHGALEEHVKFFQTEDSRLRQQRGVATGLTERAQDLVNNTVVDRERYLAAQKAALRSASTPERKKHLEAIINHDDLNQSEQLMRQSSTNFWGGMANRLLSSIDLVGVASGNYVGAALETAISQLYVLAERDMPVEERRALARDLAHLKRYPDDPKNSAILKRVEALEEKKKDALLRRQLGRAKDALEKKDFERALFHVELASFLNPESGDVEKLRRRAAAPLREIDEARKKNLAAVAAPKAGSPQQQDVELLLEALTLRDSNRIQRVALDVERKNLGTPLADAARDAEAVGLELKGWREAAKKAIEQIAKSAATPEARQRAAALLRSPEYNLLTPFEQARTERQLQSAKYVLLGENFLRKNLLFAAGAMAAGPGGAATLGMANAIMLGSNLYQVMTHNPISAQPVIDAGVDYVRNHPQSENASEVYKILASAYEERGMFDKAIGYHQLAGSPKEKIATLQDRAAKALLNAANRSGSRATREYYLTSVVDHHPDTPAAAEATRKLAEIAREENQGLRMSKQFLMEHPELYGPRGLGLKPALFDGNPHNMEIADRGVNLVNDNEVLIYYHTPWGVRSQSYPLPGSISERFFMTLREKNHQVALADINRRARDSVGGFKDLPSSIVRAEREGRRANIEDRDDTTFALILEAEGRRVNYPRVLDHQMLSDNERDPGSKYKLPPIQGSISASRFSLSGGLPAGLGGNQVAVGSDHRSAFAGVQLPIPLLDGFIPVDFMVQGRPGGVSLYPRIRTAVDAGVEPELYR